MLKIIITIICLILFLFVCFGLIVWYALSSEFEDDMEGWGNEDKGRWK